jgi:hypothetical protein
VLPDWWRTRGHSLAIDDLASVIDEPPEVLVIGRGANNRMVVPPGVKNQLEAKGIQVVAQPTGEACKTYNRLRETRTVVAALHLTC